MTLLVALMLGCTTTTVEPTPETPPTPEAPVEVKADGPNVLVIVWDTARADRLGTYGYDKPTTPWLDKWSKQAVVFDHAIATSEWTAPTHASLFTGQPLRTHGVDVRTNWLEDSFTTAAEHFGSNGYDTYAFSSNHYVSEKTNMLQGFAHTDFSFKGPWRRAAAQHTQSKLIATDKSTEISPAWTPHGKGQGWSKKMTLNKEAAPVAHKALVQWLDQRTDKDKPFFAFLNVVEAHQPRVPSLESRKAVSDDKTIEKALETDSTLFRLMAYMSKKHEYTPEELGAMSATYDAAIRDLDNATRDLITDLERRGELDNTVIVLTADHGELLGEHHMYSHRWALYEELIHVPLIVWYPKKLEAKRVPHAVSVASVFPTLNRLAELPPVPSATAPQLDAAPAPVFSELRDPNKVMKVITQSFPDVSPNQFNRSLQAVIDGQLKLIAASDHAHELYDLEVDGGEASNLYETRPEDAKRLHELLKGFNEAHPPHRPTKGAGAASEPMSIEEQRQLCLLGYVDCPEEDGQ